MVLLQTIMPMPIFFGSGGGSGDIDPKVIPVILIVTVMLNIVCWLIEKYGPKPKPTWMEVFVAPLEYNVIMCGMLVAICYAVYLCYILGGLGYWIYNML